MRIFMPPPITKRRANLLDRNVLRLNIRQTNALNVSRLPWADPVQWAYRTPILSFRVNPMKKLIFAVLLIASPAWAQTKILPKSITARVDNCAPIGRTEDGKLVYSMKCETLPAPVAPPPQAEAAPAPPPEPEIHRSGIFGLSYEVKRPDQ
jgi:hypothetical protein